ncbi:MAG: hypothetical protein WA709_14285 [Stellaceae bacterium]
MKHVALAVIIAAGTLAFAQQSHAAACANGVYRAGCVGPNGAAVVRKPAPVYRTRAPVTCANGVYRAGCVGPNGAAVVRKPY